MKSVFLVLALAALGSACEGLVVVISTGPTSVAGAHVDGGVIAVGSPVNGALKTHGGTVQYRVVAPQTGTLALGVSWDKSQGLVDVLFASNMLPRPLTAPPFNARVPVQAGQSYDIQVADGAPSDAGTLTLGFTLTTTMEQRPVSTLVN